MRATSILSLLSCLAYSPLASAWIYTWHSPNDTLLSYQGAEPLACKSMNNPVGNVFNWEPQDGHWCIFMYSNSNCSDENVGYTCKDWEWASHASTKHILSFQVTNNTSSFSATATSSISATQTSTSISSTATSTTPSAATATATSEPTGSNSKASLSGGAIAGIVLRWLLLELSSSFCAGDDEKNNAQKIDNTRTESATGMVELPSSHPEEEHSYISEKPRSRQETLRELKGSTAASEIGPGTERHELHSPVVERHELYTERYELDSTHPDLEKKP
ncbi:hypothetical protein N7509_012387 [Penicillium cosmopolitanum]|uniref:Uncharacterized protein n=1 Tax=Penicillium cosmopolitanum TaxID=1131564 RepID=A0A9W9VEL4_9EURO|nr:uncharacterized protein N7509_012387 [Penicillium cosmopolitanum]KAJ5379268.1 hypothetical protein N7509_012387 [Penicillium cosmopolitanum]